MTDPLAHLYAETGAGDLDDVLDLDAVETSLDELNSETGAHAEELSESDLAELAVLVGARLEDEGGLPDEEAAELGLGEIREVPGADFDHELVLNDVGRAVLKRIVEQRHPGIRFGVSS